ncbi:hypothetical protein BCR44DRAFT_1440815 [Catenaria anguillulae PL171]|uniref:Uncharacterized protein n=1 Tax=Catenaria anguillulae PL171 TaxID=765915 RepID=A0A1Y2HCF1_9FUNG|nr:hypothetical protein BCR44DRAFT_1440815 [Catenaria anguillulae PL171]
MQNKTPALPNHLSASTPSSSLSCHSTLLLLQKIPFYPLPSTVGLFDHRALCLACDHLNPTVHSMPCCVFRQILVVSVVFSG